MEAIRSLVDRIEVGPPEGERAPCTVTLVGALASVLAFVSEQEGAAATQKASTASSAAPRKPKSLPFPGGFRGTSLVVAGAGFEPAAFRL